MTQLILQLKEIVPEIQSKHACAPARFNKKRVRDTRKERGR